MNAMFSGVERLHDVMIPMRDGIRLAGDIYLPPCKTPAPALLLRTPYNKRVGECEGYAHPSWYARHGFAVVCQDVRGTFQSEGELHPFHYEAEDGFDTIEWIAEQSWCDGQVGMYGFSYPGATQLLAATASPPHLKAMAPAMTASDYYEGWTYHQGALQLAFVLSWAAGLGRRQAVRAGDSAALSAFDALLQAPASLYARLPLLDALPPELERHAPFLREWLQHPRYDEYWQRIAPRESYLNIQVPSLHIAGWYDIFLEGTLENFTQLQRQNREEQFLVVGPWFHMPWSPTVGACDFGPEAHNLVDETQLRFFRRILLGQETGQEPPVRLFVMGANQWRTFDRWPPPCDRRLVLHLHSDGRAASISGTGVLKTAAPGHQPPDIWPSDPAHPVLSLGGRSGSLASRAPMGPANQQSEESRNDLQLYTSAALEQPVTVIGTPVATLYTACDSPSSDLVVRLVDVHPDGTAINVSDGNARTTSNGAHGIYKISIHMSPTAIRFAAGHRIRLHVCGTSFPALDRNPGTDTPATEARADELHVITQAVFHDGDYPSRLALPIIEEQQTTPVQGERGTT